MAVQRKIPIPWRQRWRRMRYQALPVLTMIVCSIGAGLLWRAQYFAADTLGHVEQVSAVAMATQAGSLVPVRRGGWSLYESVMEGQVVARLDDRPALARVAGIEAELAQLAAQLPGSRTNAAGGKDAAAAIEHERAHLDLLGHLARGLRLTVEVQRAESVAADAIRSVVEMTQTGAESGEHPELREAIAARDAAQARLNAAIEARDAGLRAADAARARLNAAALTGAASQDQEAALASVRAGAAAQEAQLRQLELEVEGLEIHAPISGRIVLITRRPGESVVAGGQVMSIASEQSDRVIAYLRPEQRLDTRVGAAVQVWPRASNLQPMVARVERVGPQLQEIPEVVTRNQRMREWGLPVLVRLPASYHARPGDVYNVRFGRETVESEGGR